ncbi:stressosome-associated protein Prli42 [Staphylococcus sp. 18_1_E_LY]|uniref:Stressosome-associated protein Prli42 n=1 Tax=Staphylococcus lloydii TaxID=2781774 RepID=A0A7T1AXR5_9STAP|nr:stressosome-associated protein Prli42 [Staphylococcus lloydii]MBF7018632.1 stressosome-associated protein Prli42 [Staphylococcus lloydii]MBF7026360.1 stressosome-associated protein Prli42 [Staphylococcus lloydii]MDU9417751.1 stressosome-associated protein Prli42 [Staphylococcus lloydii]QPM74034.1 stressosome-associated protein Prli42 [Staphylococcus lloydii]
MSNKVLKTIIIVMLVAVVIALILSSLAPVMG